MWDSNFMADINNFAEINDNFDTIKTLLNSIRAQGILNTSDVDKLLTGINSKLEKLNTEEDIDLIKIFLSELKQNLDERHSILVSKFAAIESLFSNLLKNSSEMPKSSELKELFDIVATNLSVFSREVVSQKDSLTDISLRIDALRSDDSVKKDIIKNITLLKPDLERLNNGFDSIVISLNDNFKTIIKTITGLDKTDYFDKFSDALNNVEMSSSALLSALQLIDKKTEQIEESISDLVTKDDLTATSQKLVEIAAFNHDISASISDLSVKSNKFDSLAEKIDASVNIIATLKSNIEDADDNKISVLLSKLNDLESKLSEITNDKKFEEFSNSLKEVVENIYKGLGEFDTNLKLTTSETEKVLNLIKSLDINIGFEKITSLLDSSVNDIKSELKDSVQKTMTLNDANITRVINDISSSADALNSRLSKSQMEVSSLCEKNFSSVFEKVSDLKNLIAQIDENSVSANNAIFSSITDRLTIFENGLRTSLETQEKCVSHSSAQLIDQIETIKNVSSVLDYKLDSSIVESGNLKKEFLSLKEAVDGVLALDFVNTVKDLRVDLYASKQELINVFEAANSDLSEKFTDDLYGKYELLISKLDSIVDEIKQVQASSLAGFKVSLENISASLVDIISYVSEQKTASIDTFSTNINELADSLKENSLNYVETVRDIVDVIRLQVENDIKGLNEDLYSGIDNLKRVVSENSEDLKKELKYSYSKLIELQDSYKEMKDALNVNNISVSDKFSEVVSTTETVKTELDSKIAALRTVLLDKVSEFKQEFTCENADKISELKFSVENLYNKSSEDIASVLSELKESLESISSDNVNGRTQTLAKILDSFVSIKEHLNTLNSNSCALLEEKMDSVTADFTSLKVLLNSLNESAAETLSDKVSVILDDFSSVKAVLERVDENIDGDMTRQLSIIESNFESLVSQMAILFDKSDQALTERISTEFATISDTINLGIAEKLEDYKLKIEDVFDKLRARAASQSDYLQERIADINSSLKSLWKEQADNNYAQLTDIANELKLIIDENVKDANLECESFKEKLNIFTNNIEQNNNILVQDLKSQLDDITKYVDSVLELQSQDIVAELNIKSESFDEKFNTITSLATSTSESLLKTNEELVSIRTAINVNQGLINDFDKAMSESMSSLKALTAEISAGELQAFDKYIENVTGQFEAQKQALDVSRDFIVDLVKKELVLVSQNIEKETDVIIGEIIEQFDLMRKNQADDVIKLTSNIEELINAHIYNGIEDLKSYLDIKTDSSTLSSKLDNLKLEMSASVEQIVNDLNKMLDAGVFTASMSDYRLANEILVNSALESLQAKLESLIEDRADSINNQLLLNNKDIEEKLSLFDKKFVETVVDKYEEIKLLTNTYNKSFDDIGNSIANILNDFSGVKALLDNKIDSIIVAMKKANESTNEEVKLLAEQFESLRSQISNKSFDEAFQASINKQIGSLEELVLKQMGYIEDITDLCSANLPDVAEMNVLVKHTLLEKFDNFANIIESQDVEGLLENELKQFKSEIITQFINVFNQVSFLAEQEEILDFIQEKHDELITVLSHIVTSADEITTVNDNLLVVDTKIDSLKEDIDLINEKITAIISSEDEIDYVYSLHDLESDIANLRIALNEVKNNNHENDFEELISSTNQVYNLVESIKSDLTDDIESISSRTNKLLLASDESYKSLQDNLQDFKLVINDLDERTRNFAEDSGLNRIDSKLNVINSMMHNGEKTNKVFNQVFEYLAEWVDNASVQINGICDKVETLDNIGQIKDMLIELKADASDNTDSLEMIEALGDVFEKQAKRIQMLENKLDKIIVESTIHHNNTKIDMSPMEETLNKFLVSIDAKMNTQQDKIKSLEAKLEEAINQFGEQESNLLTKKVGGMDRKISKLSKSIEMLASHVVEK